MCRPVVSPSLLSVVTRTNQGGSTAMAMREYNHTSSCCTLPTAQLHRQRKAPSRVAQRLRQVQALYPFEHFPVKGRQLGTCGPQQIRHVCCVCSILTSGSHCQAELHEQETAKHWTHFRSRTGCPDLPVPRSWLPPWFSRVCVRVDTLPQLRWLLRAAITPTGPASYPVIVVTDEQPQNETKLQVPS